MSTKLFDVDVRPWFEGECNDDSWIPEDSPEGGPEFGVKDCSVLLVSDDDGFEPDEDEDEEEDDEDDDDDTFWMFWINVLAAIIRPKVSLYTGDAIPDAGADLSIGVTVVVEEDGEGALLVDVNVDADGEVALFGVTIQSTGILGK